MLPKDISALFGKGTTLRGSEQAYVSRGGGREIAVAVAVAQAPRLLLDALDRAALGDGSPLRVRGPLGSVTAPPVESVNRVLALPAGLLRSWRLEVGQRITIQAGTVAFGDIVVEEGDGSVRLDRADALAARLEEGDTVRWNRDLTLTLPSPPADTSPKVRATGRLITENDVRQARLRGQHILLGPGHLVTPAARSLGRELGVLREA